VAELVLVRSMRAFAASVLLLCPLTSFANTYSMAPLTKEDFVGTWEAIVQDESMASGVYQMLVPKSGNATLIQLFANGHSMFFGHASSYELSDGHIKIRFMMDPDHVHYFDWIEIQGSAVGEARGGAIVGKLIKHRTGTVLDEWSESVFFKKGRWVQYLDVASKEAEKTLQGAKIEDGHAVPKKP
jgi:hypothetical protein